ncbi:type II secretion system protein [Candidatus Ozemobacteraceae bacterium]|nr:type II secretion system protein [Candidatus Ozemobacteraceae bacterium]
MKKHPAAAGFSLIEIMMASITFLLILTGLATTFQAGITTNKAIQDLGDCQQALRDAVRLISEGDGATTDPHPGLFEASHASIGAGGELEYRVGAATWKIWVTNGQIRRERVNPGLPIQKNLAGEPLPPLTEACRTRLMFSPDTSPANPPAVIVNDTASIAVRLTLKAHRDRDGDNSPSGDEISLTLQPTIYLRNSEN